MLTAFRDLGPRSTKSGIHQGGWCANRGDHDLLRDTFVSFDALAPCWPKNVVVGVQLNLVAADDLFTVWVHTGHVTPHIVILYSTTSAKFVSVPRTSWSNTSMRMSSGESLLEWAGTRTMALEGGS
jgi:hypothetical protein